jgi:FtsZ-interacting cell division protein YlmF
LDNLRDRSFQIGPFKGFAVNEEHEDVEDEYIDDNYSEATPKASAKDKRAKGGKRTAPSSKKRKNKKAKAPTAAEQAQMNAEKVWDSELPIPGYDSFD